MTMTEDTGPRERDALELLVDEWRIANAPLLTSLTAVQSQQLWWALRKQVAAALLAQRSETRAETEKHVATFLRREAEELERAGAVNSVAILRLYADIIDSGSYRPSPTDGEENA